MGLSDELCKFLDHKIRRKRIERESPDSRKVDSFVSSAKLVKRNFPPRETRISTIKSLETGSWHAPKFSCKFHPSHARTHAWFPPFLSSLARLIAICRRRYFFFRAEPGSSLRCWRPQDRVRGEWRGWLVEQVRLHRGPSSEINGWRDRREDQGRDGERERRERERERLNRRAKRGREKQRGRITIR